jgi:major membrane immunogen (membrane-anchored lipoprotein)
MTISRFANRKPRKIRKPQEGAKKKQHPEYSERQNLSSKKIKLSALRPQRSDLILLQSARSINQLSIALKSTRSIDKLSITLLECARSIDKLSVALLECA